MPYYLTNKQVLRSLSIRLLSLTLVIIASWGHGYNQHDHQAGLAKEPFREPGADLDTLFFSSPEVLYYSHERFIAALESRLAQPPKIYELPHPDNHLLHEYRENMLLFALNNRHWLTGTGSNAIIDARMFASLIIGEFANTTASLVKTAKQSNGHVLAMAALSMTDETLHILQLVQSYLPEANVELLRVELDNGLRLIQKIVQDIIPNAHHNGLVTPTLIQLNSTLGRVLSPLASTKKSVYVLDELRAQIDNILTSFNTSTYHPAVNIDPPAIIENAKPAQITTSAECFRWPWPTSDHQQYLICKDRSN